MNAIATLIALALAAGAAENTPITTTSRAALRDLAEKRGLLIGPCVSTGAFKNAMKGKGVTYTKLLAREFNILTPENAGKMHALSTGPNQWDFRTLDAMFDFAEEHRMKVRLHTGIWHRAVPGWIGEGDLSDEQIAAAAREHIAAVGKRYAKRMAYWDVVNEAIDDKTFGLRKSLWLKALGEDYLDDLYRRAHKAAPNVKLVYNDYGIIGGGRKTDAVYELVKGMQARGVPIHAVGFQCHFVGKQMPSAEKMAETLRRFAKLGVEVHITELDIATKHFAGDRAKVLATQADRYARVMKAFLSVPEATVLQTWGFTDRYTWLRNFLKDPQSAPLLFDEDYRPKPAYEAVWNALQAASPPSAPK